MKTFSQQPDNTLKSTRSSGNNYAFLQPKLKVGKPGDKYEREADRVADNIMKMEPKYVGIPDPGDALQRKYACGGSHEGECDRCRQKRLILQRKSSERLDVYSVPPIVEEVLQSPGRPLYSTARNFMESRFGYDFSNVRVYDDNKAVESANAVNALAYTVGNNIIFNSNRYRNLNFKNNKLLAHELTHVIQQTHGTALQSIQRKPADQEVDQVDDVTVTDLNSWIKTLDNFDHNSSLLTGEHLREIEKLVSVMALKVDNTSVENATIVITGHTDTSGKEKYNEVLGLKRAEVTKTALETALKNKMMGNIEISIATESAGEKRLAKETADNIKEPQNRRVEITVKIENKPAVVLTQPEIPSPDARADEKTRPIDLNLPFDYKLPEESWWERTERERKMIEEYDRKHRPKPKSLTDLLVESVTKVLDPIIKKLPEGLRDKARDGIRKGIEAGTEKGCETAIDSSGVKGNEAESLKAACKAALKTKYGE